MMPVNEDPNLSLEHIMASELYPKKGLLADDESLTIPFPVLPGESVEFLGKTDGGVIALSNFRLFVRFKDAFINIPLGLIENVEYRDIFFINIYCKDAHSLRCTFSTNEACLEWYKRLSSALAHPAKLQDVFAFAFHAWCADQDCSRQGAALEHGLAYSLCRAEDSGGGYSFGREVDRMEFDLRTAWRICYLNEDYKVCSSYPRHHLVPACMTDRDLKMVANFRAAHRFPSVVWRCTYNGAVIARSSQPEVGWLGWRNVEDERLLQAISAACALNTDQKTPNGHAGEAPATVPPKKMLIIDARSYTAAWANRAKGGGCECIEYYPNCDIQFMSLPNIHTVRKSFYGVRALCALGPEQPNWLTSVENTKWLLHIGQLLRSALLVVNTIDKEGRPVLVHCSDGWDRTPQLVALSELMLDPYYRTLEGFRVLVEREWLSLGHKFVDRCGNAMTCEDVNERCPVFLQWLDCVHQLQLQFPCAFQFNEAFLVKLAHHTYSGLFGTFLCNTEKEREEAKLQDQTNSVWSLLTATNRRYVNLLYKTDSEQVLRPSCHMRHLLLWQAVYLSETAPAAPEELTGLLDDDTTEVLDSHEGAPPMSKTRSCDDITTALEEEEGTEPNTRTRRLSDPQVQIDSALLHSTETVVMATTTSTKGICNGHVISNGVSSETLTEAAGVTVTPLTNSVVEDNTEEDSTPSDTITTETITMDSCPSSSPDDDSASQYGIARIDSPTASAQQPLPGVANGFLGHQNGSTDTLTGDVADLALDNTRTTTKSPASKSSQSNQCPHGAIGSVDRQTVNGDHGETMISKLARPTHNGRQHTPLRLEDVLSKLDIDGLLGQRDDDRFAASLSRGSSSGREDGCDSSVSSYQCRTPNCSTGPPTPGTELKGMCPWFRGQSTVARQLDCDGLTSHTDPVQSRLSQLEADYQRQISTLRGQLQVAKAIIYQYTSSNGVNGTHRHGDSTEEVLCGESADSVEQGSLGAGSTAASDVSWEAVEEREAHMTLWVPDHAVTHCAGCSQEFWIVRRKHHCRNCGQIFCNECTKHATPLPDQQLNKPQRVCVKCYHSIAEVVTATIAEGIFLDTSTKEEGAVASC